MATEEVPAKIKPPGCIELKVSLVDKKRIGSFSLEPIKKDTEFGPYEGRIVYNKDDDSLDAKFSWEVFDLKTFKYLHTIDATNPDHGNWMRYVCCARFFEEQNIVSTQNGCEVYYRALKDIEAGEELLTWFQPKKKKRKKSLVKNLSDTVEYNGASSTTSTSDKTSEISNNSVCSSDKQKRRRKPKVIPDAYDGPLDWSEKELQAKKIKDNVFEPLQPGQKRRRRKKASSDSVESEVNVKEASPIIEQQSNETDENVAKSGHIKLDEDKMIENKQMENEQNSQKNKKSASSSCTIRRSSSASDTKKEAGPTMSIAEINNTVDWQFPPSGEEYNFVLKKRHIVTDSGKKIYKCDICLGLYKHMFSLKRHYLRNHINYKYLSKSDMTNCLINLAQVKNLMRSKFPEMKQENEGRENKGEEDSIKTNKKVKDVDSADTVKTETGENVSVENTEVKAINKSSPESVQDSDKHNQSLESNTVSKVRSDLKEDANEIKNESKEDIMVDPAEKSDNSSHKETCNSDQKIETSDNENAKSEACGEKSEAHEDNNEDTKEKTTDTVVNTEVINAGDAMQRERKAAPMPGLFRCYTCYLTFDDFISIREHTQNHPEQTDGACFPCDMCSMRFNYKHNLVRHRKTHDLEGKTLEDGDKKVEKSDVVSPNKQLLSKISSSPEKKPLLLPTVFRCGVCPQKFDTQASVVKHVKEEHKSGSKFQCTYCGKDFLSMPNMKKHVRFHLGYRATCRICSEAFSNVGALRKHTRVSHPDIYKAKLIERLEKFGELKGPDKNALSKDVIERVNLSRKNSQESKEKEPCETDKKEVKVETVENQTKVEEVDNDINFTADEIDDGGSRFKFACTVCKKRFSSYINMCRHRRKIHSNENRHRTEQCLTFGRKPRNNPSPIFENPVEVAAFYANISHNIATNLNCFIDGKIESLQTFVDHVKIENYSGNFGYSLENEQPNDLTWEKYNFPLDYKPMKTVSFADIKNVLDIHNDFDSHCMSVDDRKPDCDNNLKNSEQIKLDDNSFNENKDNSNSIKHLTETRNEQANYNTSAEGVTESVEDSEVSEINSEKLKEGNLFDNCCDISKEGNTMGKSAHGLKAFANLGSVLLKRGTADVKNVEVDKVGKLSVGASMYTDSPAAKTFHQVKLGEYANFQDDLMPIDMDCPVTKQTRYNPNTDSVHCNLLTDEEKTCIVQESEMLNKSAQDQLEALYDSIDNCEPVPKITRKSPKSLCELCEQMLGLRRSSKKNHSETSLDTEVANHLKLSTSEVNYQYIQTAVDDGPNFADEPEESPFYNYESIMFGKNGNIQQVCGVCKKHFSDIDSLMRHHVKKHPSVQLSFLQVEQGYEIEELHYSEPSTVGALAVTDPGLDNAADMDTFRCTNCSAAFKTVSKLHVHMINCSSIDPIFGVQKMENCQTRTPLKKKLQKKIFSLFGNKTDGRNDLNSLSFKLSQQRNETQSPKRVFTGCRKRTSCILPDSPQKLISEQKLLLPTSSGYNPHNHVRRRELTEILDTLTCEACGLKFKTIILLERHVKYCTKKEKFKNIQPMACPLIDESLEKLKNMCFYCNKNFTYTKSLVNHFQDFCPIKRAKLDKGELTEQDKMKESEIIERIQKADEEKAYKPKEVDNRPKRNIPWQVGRKSRRKGHFWTNIKRRNQLKQTSGATETVEEYDDIDGYDSSESELGMEGNNHPEPDGDNTECEYKEEIVETKSDVSECVKIANSEACDKEGSEINDTDSSGKQDPTCVLDKDEKSCNKDPLVGISNNIMSEEESLAAISVIQDVMPTPDISVAEAVVKEVMKPSEITQSVAVLQDSLLSVGNTSINTTDSSFSEKDGPLTLYTCIDVNNTSLNCTARYNVNLVNPVKKYRPIAPKPKSSSSMLHCISKLFPPNKTGTVDTAKYTELDKNATLENGIDIKSTEVTPSEDKDRVSATETKEEEKFKLAEQGLITGKRKRARVGRVEEFLRNAFKRKKNKIEQEKTLCGKESTFTIVEQGSHKICNISNVGHNLEPNCEFTEKNKVIDGDKFSSGDASYLKSKQAEENTLNKISQVVSKRKLIEDKQVEENVDTSVQMNENISNYGSDQYCNEQQHFQNESCMTIEKSKLDSNLSTGMQKRGRGRPKGSGLKKLDENKVKPVPGRKRGRPRKTSLPVSPTTDNDDKCTSFPSDSKNNEFSATNSEQEKYDETDFGEQISTKNSDKKNVSDYREAEVIENGDNLQLGEAKVCFSNESAKEISEEEIDGSYVNGNIFCSDDENCIKENRSNRIKAESEDGFEQSVSEKSYEKKDELNDNQVEGEYEIHKCETVINNEIEEHHKKVINKKGVEVVKLNQSESINGNQAIGKCDPEILKSCKNESFDEVDGIGIKNTEFTLYRKNQLCQDTYAVRNDELSLTNHNAVTFISEQTAERCPEKMTYCAVSNKNENETDDRDISSKSPGEMNTIEVECISSCDSVDDDLKCELEQSKNCSTVCPNEHDVNETKSENIVEQKEIDNDENMDANSVRDVECVPSRSESKTNKTTEFDSLLEPVLSPGERVKMNKRSCKKDVDLSSPVWVKRTKLHKGKTEKKQDDLLNDGESNRKAQHRAQRDYDSVDENACNSDDNSLDVCRKRKISELDIDIAPKLKHVKHDSVKGSVKANVRSKK